MAFRKIRDFLIPIITFLTIITISTAIILFGKGYRLDFGKNKLRTTGLIAATSDPTAAQVYVDNVLRTATNNSVGVDPGWYTVRISKEGYIHWEKRIRVQGEVVARADAFLFPTSPSLSPLTSSGIVKPTLSSDGTKIAYIVPFPTKPDAAAAKNAGIWMYELIDRPLGINRDPKHIAGPASGFDSAIDPAMIAMIWSPDGSQLMVSDGTTVKLYQTARLDDFKIITPSYETTLKEWADDEDSKEKAKLAAFKQPIIDMATSSAKIIAFSPDETKMLYQATASAIIPQVIIPPLLGTNSTDEERRISPGKFYIYDSREDRNYFLLDPKELPQPKSAPKTKGYPFPVLLTFHEPELPIRWFPTNRHLLLMLADKVDVLEYDRTNWITVYSGPFTDGFMAPWPTGSRIVIMTNLNPGTQPLPNLYTINLR